MTEDERAAALEALDRASEFRFVYWTGDGKSMRYTVERDWDHRSGRWGIFDGEVASWTGEAWECISRRPDAFRWPLYEALQAAAKLAYEMNQHFIERMERRYPGQFRGGEHDLATA